MRLVFDLESDNLLYDATVIWCISAVDLDTEERLHFGPQDISEGVRYLQAADLLIGHNIAGFDVPLMEKLHRVPYFNRQKLRDTYVMSKLFFPNRPEHSLESWGNKVGVQKVVHEDWTQYSAAMRIRCDTDVELNSKLYTHFVDTECKKWPQWKESIVLECEMHYWQALQELAGVGLDVEKALALVKRLDEEIALIDAELDAVLPMYCKQVGTTVSKPFKKNGEHTKAVEDWFNAEADTTSEAD